ncbi:hypothetical protein [Burkholderia sp. Bp9143]|uniref:hypothetical protein n=1 Tax=Burkholderia sp. Bp9143 TaxID=2184574 RepID=UPI0021AB420B|nr:hypothetical protein [Burkholderia sp. Bp9143]
MASARFGGATGQESLLNRIIAISAIVDIPTSGGIESVADIYIANGQDVWALNGFTEVDEFLTAHRLLRWEDDLTRLLDAGTVSHEAVTEAIPRTHGIATFLAKHAATRPD